jgi:hypothetical protein
MKLLLLALLLPALAQQPSDPAPDANAQQARQILDQCIKALGGNAYLTIRDMKQTGRGYGFHNNASTGVGVQFVRYYVYPDKDRYEYLNGDWVIINIGDKGYETTFRGTKEEDPKDLATYVRRHQYALDIVLRDWLKQPGTALFYDGPTIAETKEVHKVTIINSQNVGVSLYINAKTFLPVKKTYSYRDPDDNEQSEEAEIYDNYRPTQGIMTPFNVTRTKNGEMNSQRFLRDVSYNTAVSDSLFTPPALHYDRLRK